MDLSGFRWMVPALTGLAGCLAVIWCSIALSRARRRYSLEIEHVREELQVMLVQQQTEARDGFEALGRELDSLRSGRQEADELLRENLSPSVRAAALRLLRSGVAAETMASTLSLSRSDARLIASVSRILTGSEPIPGASRPR